MTDITSVASNSSEQSNDKQDLSLEDKLGFKPNGTNNYLCTIFNNNTSERKIMFDGAMPLHEFAPLLYEFLYIYINKSKTNETYMLSVITYEGDVVNIAILPGGNTLSVRKSNVKDELDSLFYIFDNVYGLFVLPGNISSKKYVKNTFIPGRKYRLQMTFSELENSYKTYNILKKKMRNLIMETVIKSDSDTEDSDNEIVNTED